MRYVRFCTNVLSGLNSGEQVPLLEMPPQLTAGQVMKQQDGIVINQKFVDIYESMIGQMNKAIKTLPILKRTSQQ